MTKALIASALIAATVIDSSVAFTSQGLAPGRVGTQLQAESGRREMLGNVAKVLGAGAFAASTMKGSEMEPELLAGLSNPALKSFRGNAKGQSFIPGKGMRAHDDELIAGLSNPALKSFRGNAKGQSFIPGKGMRSRESFDELC